jgi:hypothetical protein
MIIRIWIGRSARVKEVEREGATSQNIYPNPLNTVYAYEIRVAEASRCTMFYHPLLPPVLQ